MTTKREGYFINPALRDRQSTARNIQADFQRAIGRRISDQTILNRLHERNLGARGPVVAPILPSVRRRVRLTLPWRLPKSWCCLKVGDHNISASDNRRNHLQSQWLHKWRNIMFLNDSRFALSRNDSRVRVVRSIGERYADYNVMEYDRFCGGSVTVWAGIT